MVKNEIFSGLLTGIAVAVFGATPLSVAGGFERGFAKTVETAGPSTVTVVTLLPPGEEELAEWERYEKTQRRMLTASGRIIELDGRPHFYMGHGSGFLIDEAGHIVTNHHVVSEHEARPEVVYAVAAGSGGMWKKCEMVGLDPATDLAVVRCPESGARPATWGDSATLQVGDIVLAIGTPRDLALRQTVTFGVVSAKGRAIGGLQYEDFIQTDASINSGNSGGPLVNVDGEVVGVNQSILLGTVTLADGSTAEMQDGSVMRASGNIGLGMAVPSSIARQVAADLIAHGSVRRGFLGVRLEEVAGEAYGLPGNCLRVAEVIAEGPAAKAGLQAGDVVLALNDGVHHTTRTFQLAVSLSKPGSQATVGVLREGKPVEVKLEVGDLAETRFAKTGFDPEARDFPGIPGVELREMRDQSGAVLVVVSQVDPASKAAKAGLASPSVITGVAGVPVQGLQMFVAAAMSSVQEGHVLLSVVPYGPQGAGEERELSLEVE